MARTLTYLFPARPAEKRSRSDERCDRAVRARTAAPHAEAAAAWRLSGVEKQPTGMGWPQPAGMEWQPAGMEWQPAGMQWQPAAQTMCAEAVARSEPAGAACLTVSTWLAPS